MKRTIALSLLLAILSPAFASAQVPAQINPQNSYTVASGSNTAQVTITGVAGQRVRLYSIDIYCGGATTIIPAVQVTDAGNLALDKPGVTTAQQNQAGSYRWLPGYAFSLGGTVVITGNPGTVCTGGTFMTIQADQF